MKHPALNLMGCLFATAIVWHAHSTFGAAPPATMHVEPQENGKLVYLPVAPETDTNSVTSLVGLWIVITNTSLSDDIVLTSIQLSFSVTSSDGGSGEGFGFIPNLMVAPGASGEWILDEDQAIQLPYPPPDTVLVQCTFEGYDTSLVQELELAPYLAPTPSGSYLWPGQRDDLAEGSRVWVNPASHNGGYQFFGHDLRVEGWISETGKYARHKYGTDGSKNTDDFGFGIPVHAMADGVVVKAESDWIENPAPGKYAIQPRGSWSATSISDASATYLDENLVATAVAYPEGYWRIHLWSIDGDGKSITPGPSTLGGFGNQVQIARLSNEKLVTAARMASGDVQLATWNTTGPAITQLSTGVLPPLEELSLESLTDTQFATASTAPGGAVKLDVWEESGAGLSNLDSVVTAQPATSLALVRLSSGRLTLARRDPMGWLRVTVWDYTDANGLQQGGENTAFNISRVDAARSTSTSLITAVRTDGGRLQILRWSVSEAGDSIVPVAASNPDDKIADLLGVASVPHGRSRGLALTCSLTADDELKLHYWELNDDKTVYRESGERLVGAGNQADLTNFNPALSRMFGVYRDGAGKLQLRTWRIANSGGGNNLVIVHGDCVIDYAHFREGTIDPALVPGTSVKAGQQLAEMGNSGNSTGPHLHIHAQKVRDGFSVNDIIALEAANNRDYRGAYRPLPFSCARVWNLAQVNAQDSLVGSTLLDRMGVYFAKFAIVPLWSAEAYVDGGSTCPVEVGWQDCESSGHGPYQTVNNALQDDCWGPALLIRAGHYKESILVDRGVVIRAYDGKAVIGQ